MGLDRDKWITQLEPIINKYNNTEHTTIKMKPTDARKETNKLMVSYNLWNNAKRDRKYPELKVGDDVGDDKEYSAYEGLYAEMEPNGV